MRYTVHAAREWEYTQTHKQACMSTGSSPCAGVTAVAWNHLVVDVVVAAGKKKMMKKRKGWALLVAFVSSRHSLCGRRRVRAEVRVCCVVCCVVCGNEAEGERDLHCSPLLEEEEEERGGDTSAAANNNTSGGRGRRRVCVHVWCDCM